MDPSRGLFVTMTAPDYQRRAVTAGDHGFLWQLFVDSYRGYVEEIWVWDEADQRKRFQEKLRDSKRLPWIIELGDEPAGFLELQLQPGCLYLANIQICPKYQGRGLGTRIIEDVIAQARRDDRDVSLQVFRVNTRALALYEALGFEQQAVTTTHVQLRRPQAR